MFSNSRLPRNVQIGIFQHLDAILNYNGAWLSPVERLLREQEAESSNLSVPTIKNKGLHLLMQTLLCYISRIVYQFFCILVMVAHLKYQKDRNCSKTKGYLCGRIKRS